jgi:hypothetical protein
MRWATLILISVLAVAGCADDDPVAPTPGVDDNPPVFTEYVTNEAGDIFYLEVHKRTFYIELVGGPLYEAIAKYVETGNTLNPRSNHDAF